MKKLVKKIASSSFWLFSIVTLAFFLQFLAFPIFADIVYRRFLFQIYRVVWDYSFGLLPIPKIVLFLLILIYVIFRTIRKNRLSGKKVTRSLLMVFAVLFQLFLWVWGFNYLCPPFVQEHKEIMMTENDYFTMGLETAGICREIRTANPIHVRSFLIESNPKKIRDAVENYLSENKWPVLGNAHCWTIHEYALMRKWGIAGIYIPYVGEGYTSDSFLNVTEVFICAHELAHAYGITSEGEADYVAYMSLRSMEGEDSDLYHYAAELELLRSIRGSLRKINNSLREMLITKTFKKVNDDIEAIKQNALDNPEWIAGVGESVNDTYLKIMGVQQGVGDYERWVEMVWRTRFEYSQSQSH